MASNQKSIEKYAGTSDYNKKNFDFIRFRKLLQVLKDMGKTVFVSEYNQPAEGFTEVASFVKMMLMNANGNISVQEKLFYGGSKEQYDSLKNIFFLKFSLVEMYRIFKSYDGFPFPQASVSLRRGYFACRR